MQKIFWAILDCSKHRPVFRPFCNAIQKLTLLKGIKHFCQPRKQSCFCILILDRVLFKYVLQTTHECLQKKFRSFGPAVWPAIGNI